MSYDNDWLTAAGLERQCAADERATFPHLSVEQLSGTECVLCWRPHPDVPIPHLGESVLACSTAPHWSIESCASQLGFRPEDGWQGSRP